MTPHERATQIVQDWYRTLPAWAVLEPESEMRRLEEAIASALKAQTEDVLTRMDGPASIESPQPAPTDEPNYWRLTNPAPSGQYGTHYWVCCDSFAAIRNCYPCKSCGKAQPTAGTNPTLREIAEETARFGDGRADLARARSQAKDIKP